LSNQNNNFVGKLKIMAKKNTSDTVKVVTSRGQLQQRTVRLRCGSTDPLVSISIGLVLLAVGIAFLANYQIGKKMLAKEMEAEERNLRQA